jgi:hypothetical protein
MQLGEACQPIVYPLGETQCQVAVFLGPLVVARKHGDGLDRIVAVGRLKPVGNKQRGGREQEHDREGAERVQDRWRICDDSRF